MFQLHKWLHHMYTYVMLLGGGHYQPGAFGAELRAKHERRELSQLEKAQLVAEALASSIGVVVSLLHYVKPLNAKGQSDAAPEAGTKVLAPRGLRYTACVCGFKVLGALAPRLHVGVTKAWVPRAATVYLWIARVRVAEESLDARRVRAPPVGCQWSGLIVRGW